MTIRHPAKFSDALLPVMARYVDGARTILDPFAGTGRVGLLRERLSVPAKIFVNELEPAWAIEAMWAAGIHSGTVGDARKLHVWRDGDFDAIVTSPAYGNRMADACDWAEGRKHSTYTSALRETVGDPTRDLRPGNAGGMQWGEPYRELHRAAWREAWRVSKPGARLVVSIADHIRDGVAQGVPEWHVSALLAIGFILLDWVEVETPRYGFGANSDKRCPELVICLMKPGGNYVDPAWRWHPGTEQLRNVAYPPNGTLWGVQPEPVQLGLFAGDRP